MKFSKDISHGLNLACVLIAFILPRYGYSQETIFTILKSDDHKAKRYFEEGHYVQALRLYRNLRQKSGSDAYDVQIARSHYYLHDPFEATRWYASFLAGGKSLQDKDIFLYAECLSASGKYDEALTYYTAYEKSNTDDDLAIKKIWQLKNREYLFEDSAQYTVRDLSINSSASDICAIPFGNGFVFLSNRRRQSFVEKVDGSNQPFYKLYKSSSVVDSVGNDVGFSQPDQFFDWLDSRYQLGPLSFYNEQKSVAFIATGKSADTRKSKRPLQLFFADQRDGVWAMRESFPFNSLQNSITSIAVSEDGNALYFSSNMPGGKGGLDLYVSRLINGTWSNPENLGKEINTSGDECFPTMWGNKLYFASTGLPGLGGLDIFSSNAQGIRLEEPVNMGYPVNTNFDDFALSLNADGSKGYLTSNRKTGNDDIYEVTMHMQSYPYTIAGILKVKEESWSDAGDLKVMPNAQLELIDNQKNMVVFKANSDSNGAFALTIPYFSHYRIKISTGRDDDEAVVSLDLGKTRNKENKYDVVVVRNSFKKSY